MSNKHYDFHLPYFKQGDDLQYFLGQQKLPMLEALEAHAQMLEGAAAELRILATGIKDIPGVEIDADCHFIGVYGDAALLKPLVDQEILFLQDYGDEEEEEEDFEEDEDEEDFEEAEDAEIPEETKEN